MRNLLQSNSYSTSVNTNLTKVFACGKAARWQLLSSAPRMGMTQEEGVRPCTQHQTFVRGLFDLLHDIGLCRVSSVLVHGIERLPPRPGPERAAKGRVRFRQRRHAGVFGVLRHRVRVPHRLREPLHPASPLLRVRALRDFGHARIVHRAHPRLRGLHCRPSRPCHRRAGGGRDIAALRLCRRLRLRRPVQARLHVFVWRPLLDRGLLSRDHGPGDAPRHPRCGQTTAHRAATRELDSR